MATARRLIAIVLVGVLALFVAERVGPGGRQRRATAHMDAFLAVALPRVRADPRFADVIVGGTSHPKVRATGTVPDAKALADLRDVLTPPAGSDFAAAVDVSVQSSAASRAVLGPG